MAPATIMPPTRERGKDRQGSMVSSATFAVFSKPVIAKNDRATPARIASAGLPSVLNSVRTPKSALPSAMYQTPMNITIASPRISTNAITMLTTTDSLMPMKFTIDRARTNSRVTSSAGGPAHSSAK